MKKILLCFITIVMFFGVTSCGIKNDFDIGKLSNVKIDNNNNVTLSIKDNTLKKTGATLILENDSDKLLHYDEYYKMEIKKDKKWHKINVELCFTDPLWEVKENSKKEFELNWEQGYGKLASGDYRIIKEVYFEGEEENAFNISAEFTIK